MMLYVGEILATGCVPMMENGKNPVKTCCLMPTSGLRAGSKASAFSPAQSFSTNGSPRGQLMRSGRGSSPASGRVERSGPERKVIVIIYIYILKDDI